MMGLNQFNFVQLIFPKWIMKKWSYNEVTLKINTFTGSFKWLKIQVQSVFIFKSFVKKNNQQLYLWQILEKQMFNYILFYYLGV